MSSVTIKTRFGEDIRRFQLFGAELNYRNLLRRVHALYFNNTPAEVNLVYLDEDGDRINVKSDMDLIDAARSLGLLRVVVEALSPSVDSTPAPAPAASPAPARQDSPALSQSTGSFVSSPFHSPSVPVVQTLASAPALSAAPSPVPSIAAAAAPASPPALPKLPKLVQLWIFIPKRNIKFDLVVPADLSVGELKTRIENERKIRVHDKRDVVFADCVLEDNVLLCDAGIDQASTIHLRKTTKREKTGKRADLERLEKLLIAALGNPTVLAALNNPVAHQFVTAALSMLPQHPHLLSMLNTGYVCKRVLPAVLQKLLSEAPLFAAALFDAINATPSLSALAPRAVTIATSMLERMDPRYNDELVRLRASASPLCSMSDVVDLVGGVMSSLAKDGAVADVLASWTACAAAGPAPTPAPSTDTPVSVHAYVTCDSCGMSPIRGSRFKCLTCGDYDLCEGCEARGVHDRTHPMVKMYVPHRTVDMGEAGFGLVGPAQPQRAQPQQQQPQSARGSFHGRHHHGRGHRMGVDLLSALAGEQCPAFAAFSVPLSARSSPAPATPAPSSPAAAAAAAATARASVEAETPRTRQAETPRTRRLGLESVRLVRDVTLIPGTTVRPGATVTKVWAVRNDSATAWPAGTVLQHVGGDLASAPVTVDVTAAPGQEVRLSVSVDAPTLPGRYVGQWQLVHAGRRVGQRLACDVLVSQ